MITSARTMRIELETKLAELAASHGITIHKLLCPNDIPVFNGVCKVAKQIGADLIVIQTHGHTGMARFFEGSHAERIVQHSPCPVLVARKLRRRASRIGSGAKLAESIDSILVPVDFLSIFVRGARIRD